jgi:Holliday junction resolvase
VSNYRRGADLERALVRHLRAHGWEAARSASSKSGIDVWAVKGGNVRLFQCSLQRTAQKEREVAEASERLGIQVRLVTKGSLVDMEVDLVSNTG